MKEKNKKHEEKVQKFREIERENLKAQIQADIQSKTKIDHK